MPTITIRDVARLAEVSIATVSRVLNGQGNVAEPIRQRVFTAARALHYTPHAGARSLSRRCTGALGVVLPVLPAEFFHGLLLGMDLAARAQGHHLLLSSHHADAAQMADAVRAMHGSVDGMIIMGSADPARRAGVTEPLVQIGADPSAEASTIAIDERAGAMAMVEHLAGLGHRRIAFVAGPDHDAQAHERLRGYREAMALRHPALASQVLPGQGDRVSGMRAALSLMAEADGLPDAVFACNDRTALGCLHAFARCGVVVPDAVSVVGYDDIAEAAESRPALTTMRVDGRELGRRAVRRLLAALASETPALIVTEVLVPTLTVRDSGAARAASRREQALGAPVDLQRRARAVPDGG